MLNTIFLLTELPAATVITWYAINETIHTDGFTGLELATVGAVLAVDFIFRLAAELFPPFIKGE